MLIFYILRPPKFTRIGIFCLKNIPTGNPAAYDLSLRGRISIKAIEVAVKYVYGLKLLSVLKF
jgi:hypothetical protein